MGASNYHLEVSFILVFLKETIGPQLYKFVLGLENLRATPDHKVNISVVTSTGQERFKNQLYRKVFYSAVTKCSNSIILLIYKFSVALVDLLI